MKKKTTATENNVITELKANEQLIVTVLNKMLEKKAEFIEFYKGLMLPDEVEVDFAKKAYDATIEQGDLVIKKYKSLQALVSLVLHIETKDNEINDLQGIVRELVKTTIEVELQSYHFS